MILSRPITYTLHLPASLLPLLLPPPFPAGEGEDEEATLAAAAAADNATPAALKPYLDIAKGKGVDPTRADHTDRVDPAILDKPVTKYGNIEALRLEALAMLASDKVQELPQELQQCLKSFAAGLYKHSALQELTGKVGVARKHVRNTLTKLNKYDPKKAETIVIQETPEKLGAAGHALDDDFRPKEHYITAFANAFGAGLNRVMQAAQHDPKEGASHLSPSTFLSTEKVEVELQELLRVFYKDTKKADHNEVGFGLWLGALLDKLAACVEVAKQKGDHETVCKLLLKCHGIQNKAHKELLPMVNALDWPTAVKLAQAVGNPFSSMKQSHWDMLVGMAGDRSFKEALEQLGDVLPASKVKPSKRSRKSSRKPATSESSSGDSESEASDTPARKKRKSAPANKRKRPAPVCGFCNKPGHTEDRCFAKKKQHKQATK